MQQSTILVVTEKEDQEAGDKKAQSTDSCIRPRGLIYVECQVERKTWRVDLCARGITNQSAPAYAQQARAWFAGLQVWAIESTG